MIRTLLFDPCPGCCDPPERCIYFSGDFSVSALPTDLWSIDSGVWPLANDQVSTTGSFAIIRSLTRNPDHPQRIVHVATSRTMATAVGDQSRVFGNFVSPVSRWYAQITFGATDSTLALFKTTGGGDVQVGDSRTLVGVAVGDWVTLHICVGTTAIRALVFDAAGTTKGSVEFATSSAADSITGIGTGRVTGTVTFEDFRISFHAEQKELCPDCRTCDPPCILGTLPPAVDIVIPTTWPAQGAGGTRPLSRFCTQAECNSILGGRFTLDPSVSGSCGYFLGTPEEPISLCAIEIPGIGPAPPRQATVGFFMDLIMFPTTASPPRPPALVMVVQFILSQQIEFIESGLTNIARTSFQREVNFDVVNPGGFPEAEHINCQRVLTLSNFSGGGNDPCDAGRNLPHFIPSVRYEPHAV